MKGLFPQFDPASPVDFSKMWSEAYFVFDTNVLLNLYRYRPETRDQLLDVLEKISSRIWIPHHVALEFQRNRLKVIADQNSRFTEIRAVVEKARDGLSVEIGKLQLEHRHSLIDSSPITDEFNRLANDFLRSLDEAQEKQQLLTGYDVLKERIESLFDGRVGPPPEDQKSLDNLFKNAADRYAKEIPPGYMDSEKGGDKSSIYSCDGLVYNKKYGDYVVWLQTLEFAKKKGIKSLIFVTDDSKEDWWWIVKSGGPKTIGARPELIDEAIRVGGISYFHMYKPEGFLHHSKEFYQAQVSKETILDVRVVSTEASVETTGGRTPANLSKVAMSAVAEWLESRFSLVETNFFGFPDFICLEKGKKFGFEVGVGSTFGNVRRHYSRVTSIALSEINAGRLDLCSIIWVVPNLEESDRLFEGLGELEHTIASRRVRNIVGFLKEGADTKTTFVPLREFSADGTHVRIFEEFDK